MLTIREKRAASVKRKILEQAGEIGGGMLGALGGLAASGAAGLPGPAAILGVAGGGAAGASVAKKLLGKKITRPEVVGGALSAGAAASLPIAMQMGRKQEQQRLADMISEVRIRRREEEASHDKKGSLAGRAGAAAVQGARPEVEALVRSLGLRFGPALLGGLAAATALGTAAGNLVSEKMASLPVSVADEISSLVEKGIPREIAEKTAWLNYGRRCRVCPATPESLRVGLVPAEKHAGARKALGLIDRLRRPLALGVAALLLLKRKDPERKANAEKNAACEKKGHTSMDLVDEILRKRAAWNDEAAKAKKGMPQAGEAEEAVKAAAAGWKKKVKTEADKIQKEEGGNKAEALSKAMKRKDPEHKAKTEKKAARISPEALRKALAGLGLSLGGGVVGHEIATRKYWDRSGREVAKDEAQEIAKMIREGATDQEEWAKTFETGDPRRIGPFTVYNRNQTNQTKKTAGDLVSQVLQSRTR